MNRFKTLKFYLLSIAVLTGTAVAQPTPPHDVFGQITDNGEAAEGITVEAEVNGDIVDSDTTDSNGDYQVRIPYQDSTYNLIVDGTEERSGVQIESGMSENYDKEGDYIKPTCGDGETYDDGSEECVTDAEEETSTGGGAATDDEDQQDEQEDEEQEDTQQSEEESDTQDKQDQIKDLEPQVNEENNSASVTTKAKAGETVRTTVPESIQDDEDTGTRVSSVSVEASGDTNVSIEVREVSKDHVEETIQQVRQRNSEETGGEQNKTPGTRENQIDYTEIDVDGNVSRQTIEFSVSESTLSERDAEPGNVVKERLDEESGEWEELDTTYLDQQNGSYRFEAVTEDNSIFATTIKKEDSEDETGDGFPTIPVVLVFLVMFLVGAAYVNRDKLEELMTNEENGYENDFSP